MSFKESKEWSMGEFGKEEGKGRGNDVIIILKIK